MVDQSAFAPEGQLPDAPPQRDESPAERLDRNLSEILQELRVAQTFVQFLFAALLAIPFQQRFATLTNGQRDVYAITLVLTSFSAVLLVAPASFHRIVFRHGLKKQLVEAANVMMQWGLFSLALALVSAPVLIVDVVSGRHALFFTVIPLAVAAFATTWYAWPWALRRSARNARRAAREGA